MPYTTLTLTQAIADLSRRLKDPNNVFWTFAELTWYIQESIQTFAAATHFYRETFSFDLVPDQTWYDISNSTLIPSTLRPQTITDLDLYTIIEYHLLEPPTGGSWTGSNQFSINDLVRAVQHRRDQLLYEAGYQITRHLQTTVAFDNVMPDTVIDVRGIWWLPNTVQPLFFPTPLWRDDQWDINSFFRNRVPSIGVPTTFRLSTQPPLTFQTDFSPIVTGDYEVLTIDSGEVLDPLNPRVLVIPNDFAWVIKWGALANMLSAESVARDPMRAQYCEMRYRQGVALLRTASAVFNAEISYTTLDIDAAQNGNNYNPTWRGLPSGVPTSVYMAGLNMMAFSPTPDSNYEVDLSVVRNAPIPVLPGDFLQIGREDYGAILDYAQHLAAFKQGGAEFTSTIPLLNNFIRHVKLYNSKLNELGEFTDIIYDQSHTQDIFFPRTQPIAVEEDM